MTAHALRGMGRRSLATIARADFFKKNTLQKLISSNHSSIEKARSNVEHQHTTNAHMCSRDEEERVDRKSETSKGCEYETLLNIPENRLNHHTALNRAVSSSLVQPGFSRLLGAGL